MQQIYMPTKVLAGENIISDSSSLIASFGDKAMIVTGKHSSRANGSLTDVINVLNANKQAYTIFDDIEENPSVETVAKAAKQAVKENVSFFIAVGGGSPMDASKAISLLTKNPEFIDVAEERLYDSTSLDSLPIIAVPTTSGTGSEVTPYAILTLHSKKTKQSMAHKVFPKLALVDYRYLRTASRSVYISTCVDALAHLIESYLNTNANDFNKMYSSEGLRVWKKVKDMISLEKEFYTDELYKNSMHASLLAGMAIAHTGTSIPHGLSYPITYELGVAHGRAVGYFLPGFLRFYGNQKEVQKVLDLLDFPDVDSFELFIKSLLGECDIPSELWERDVNGLLSNKAKLKNYPFDLSTDILKQYK